MIAGIGSRNYTFERVAYGLPVPDVKFEKRLYVPWKLLNRRSQWLKNTYFFCSPRGNDIFHVWNGICANNRPWITSFEAHLPRYFMGKSHKLNRWGLERLAHRSCRRILALSEAARNFFIWQNDGQVVESIRDKLDVLYGGVCVDAQLVSEHRQFLGRPGPDTVICLVGHEFFRKGGWPVLLAMRRLSRNQRVRLKVISALRAGDYASRENAEQSSEARRMMQVNPAIEWYESLPYEEVVQHLCRSHVAVLPTLDDTLGWSVIEAMSIGLPVITTNVFALPEIVDDEVNGFTIELPLQENRRWAGLALPKGSEEFRAERQQAYNRIVNGLVETVQRFADDPALIQKMGEAAVKKVRTRFHPETQGRRLRQIYDEALAG